MTAPFGQGSTAQYLDEFGTLAGIARRGVPRHVSGGAGVAAWYPSATGLGHATSGGTTLAPAVGTLIAAPFLSWRRGLIDALAWEVTVAGGVGSVARVGVYAPLSDTNLYPGALVVDGGEVDTTVVRVNRHTGLAIPSLPARVYWAAFLAGVASPTVRATVGDSVTMVSLFGVDGDAATLSLVQRANLNVAQPYGALPSLFPSSATLVTTAAPLVLFRYST